MGEHVPLVSPLGWAPSCPVTSTPTGVEQQGAYQSSTPHLQLCRPQVQLPKRGHRVGQWLPHTSSTCCMWPAGRPASRSSAAVRGAPSPQAQGTKAHRPTQPARHPRPAPTLRATHPTPPCLHTCTTSSTTYYSPLTSTTVTTPRRSPTAPAPIPTPGPGPAHPTPSSPPPTRILPAKAVTSPMERLAGPDDPPRRPPSAPPSPGPAAKAGSPS